MKKPAVIAYSFGSAFAASLVLSTIHPWGNPRVNRLPGAPLLDGANTADSVRAVLEAKCGDCHSEKTRYPVYSYLAPVSWMIEHDVQDGRSHLNMSRWQSYGDDNRINVLTRIASAVHAEQMPPETYVWLHPGARLSSDEAQLIYNWAKSERKRIRQENSHRSDQSAREAGRENP